MSTNEKEDLIYLSLSCEAEKGVLLTNQVYDSHDENYTVTQLYSVFGGMNKNGKYKMITL